MARVEINGAAYEAAPGERLSDLLIRTGNAIPMPCGGRGNCGKCRVTVNGQTALACETVTEAGMRVTLPRRETVVSVTGDAGTEKQTAHSALALDIGTTTLALALVSLDEGSIVRVVTGTNPQRAFGADVMNRIGYCKAHGPDRLRDAVIAAVNSLLQELDAPADAVMFVAGNTAMLHLFFGADPSPMGAAPYTPVFLDVKKASGADLGLPGVKEAVSLPGAAAFVGADLTAGLNFVGFPPEGKHRLLIDLGTNAEVVLFSRASALCTAAAAGPCFEGANISCGMSASPGAIAACSPEGCVTIDNLPAVGVCGTGLVDAVAMLLENGSIDETGYMEEAYALAPDVYLTPADVRQYQLAKSAIRAAAETLVRRARISFDDIDALYISGGFSAKINVRNAVKTGLLPAALENKCIAVNNSSLLGTAKFACERNDLYQYLAHMRCLDLSSDPVFSELFIENMTFEEAFL